MLLNLLGNTAEETSFVEKDAKFWVVSSVF